MISGQTSREGEKERQSRQSRRDRRGKAERKHQDKASELKTSRDLARLIFSCFPEAPENYFSKFRVLIP